MLNSETKDKVVEYFDSRFGLRESTKNFLRMDCVFCGGKNTAAINREHLKYHCFKCTEPISSLRVIMEIENLQSFGEVTQFLKLESISRFGFLKNAKKKAQKQELVLPEGFSPIHIKDGSKLGTIARKYMQSRGFKLTELSLRGVGYTCEGDYAGYIIFPFYSLGALKFFQGRRFAGAGPKMKNPIAEIYGIGKSQLIYNSDALIMYDEINLVESITNALTLDENTIAILGKTLSDYQRDLLLKSPVTTFNIILDPDAWADALKMAASLLPYKKVKLTKLPQQGVDVNELGYDKAMKYILKAKLVDHKDILRLRLNETTQLTYN